MPGYYVAEDSTSCQLLSSRSLKAGSPAVALSASSPLGFSRPRESSENDSFKTFAPENGHKSGPQPAAELSASERVEMKGSMKAETSFSAETVAFTLKNNAHELAIRRLVEDLIGDESGETNTNATVASAVPAAENVSEEMGNDNISGSASASANQSVGASASSLGSKKANASKPAVKSKSLVNERQSSLKAAILKRPHSLLVRTDHISTPESKERVRSLKDKVETREKASPSGPSHESPESSGRVSSSKGSPHSPVKSLKISLPSSEKMPKSSSRTSPGKLSSRHVETSRLSPKSKASVNSLDKQGTSENKVQRRVQEFLQLSRSATGFGSRKPGFLAGDNESVVSSERLSLLARDNPDLGPFLLKQARQAVAYGDNPQKALDFATRAAKSYEIAADGKPSLDLVMCLHILAAIHCTLGQFEDAVPVLQQSVIVPDIETGGQEHALAAFAGHMQLGDTFALLGKGEDAIASYQVGLEIQKRSLGETDPRVGETCRYLAEAHAQAMQFDKAEELCQRTLDIHKAHSAPASIEEATDRRLMGLICNGKGQHESALEHLVLASMALIANRMDVEVAAVDVSIGDTYVLLGRFDEAVFAYQKALTVLKAAKGENHAAVASVYVSLAELYLKTGKLRECRTYCEIALRIYATDGAQHQLDMVATGLTDTAVIYEALGDPVQALSLLQKALTILESAPGQQGAVAGVEAQIGTLMYMSGKYEEAYSFFSKAVSKLSLNAEKTCSLPGLVLNQMGLCCVHLSALEAATQSFEQSSKTLEAACGPNHLDTLSVYSNLAGAYDALGRSDDAIRVLEYVVGVREESGASSSELDDERKRLAELLKESRYTRSRRINGAGERPMQRGLPQKVLSS